MGLYSNYNSNLISFKNIYINPNDKLDFIIENYYPNGQLELRGRLKNNIQEGHWTWWHENGIKKDETYFNNKYSTRDKPAIGEVED